MVTNADRFWQRVDAGPGCWNWTGDHNSYGYG
jgi:hypothetical protein